MDSTCNLDIVLGIFLGGVHCGVGLLEQPFRRHGMFRAGGDTDADCQLQLQVASAAEHVVLHPLAQPFADHLGAFEGCFGQDDDEFIPPVPDDDVGVADLLVEQLTHFAEGRAAHKVAMSIVYELEVVNIYEKQGQIFLVPEAALDLESEVLAEIAEIIQTCQITGRRTG